ncbi:MAG TPA: carboxypeptidase-like regulatory domain-containing protein, partial [Terracidiphilus sp.]
MVHISRTGWRVCLWLLALLAIPLMGWSQSTRGALAGTVSDPSGAVIANAQIVAIQVETQTKYEAISSSAGAYRFPELSLGRYDVTVSAPGFAPLTQTGVLITINSTAALNVTLKPGGTNETVTVDASSPTIESETSDMSGTISQKQIQDLPLSMAGGVGGLRSPETFAFLVPGTTGPGSAVGGTAFNSNGVFLGKIAGGQTYGSETLLDGSSIQRSENGSSFDETSPSIEALQEFKVTTATPSAEFGRSTAGFESFATKGGANSMHGSAYTFVKNAAFDGNNWYNNGYWVFDNCSANPTSAVCQSYRRPQDSKFDYGGTFSGPVWIPHIYNGHDKTFFLFAWEQFRLSQGGSVTSTVPTAAEKQGDFSALLGGPTAVINPCDGKAVLQNQIFDPATTNATVSATNPNGIPCREPFVGNKVPTGRFSKAAGAMMTGLPDPNQNPLTTSIYGFGGNYTTGWTNPNQNTTYTIRVDHSFSEKSHLYASYSSRDNWSVHGAINLPMPFNNSGYLQDFETHYPRAGWDYSFTPNLLNHLNAGYNRTNSINYAYQVNSP